MDVVNDLDVHYQGKLACSARLARPYLTKDGRPSALDPKTLLPTNRNGSDSVLVHRGFYRAHDCSFAELERRLQEVALRGKRTTIYLIGHILGGAKATLDTIRLRLLRYKDVHLISFGAPAVGNKHFARSFEKLFPVGNIMRVVNSCGIVPHLIPDNVHISQAHDVQSQSSALPWSFLFDLVSISQTTTNVDLVKHLASMMFYHHSMQAYESHNRQSVTNTFFLEEVFVNNAGKVLKRVMDDVVGDKFIVDFVLYLPVIQPMLSSAVGRLIADYSAIPAKQKCSTPKCALTEFLDGAFE
jgi:hypothetical protein